MNTLKRKAERAFQGKCAAQKRLSEGQAEIDRKEWERKNADITLCVTNRQLESQRVERYQANQLTNQTQREESWLIGELDMRTRVVQEDRAKDCQKLRNYEEFVVRKRIEPDN